MLPVFIDSFIHSVFPRTVPSSNVTQESRPTGRATKMSVKCKLQLSQTVTHSYEERQHIFNYLAVKYCDLLFFTLLVVGFLMAVSMHDNLYN